jgi:hypothetical protein
VSGPESTIFQPVFFIIHSVQFNMKFSHNRVRFADSVPQICDIFSGAYSATAQEESGEAMQSASVELADEEGRGDGLQTPDNNSDATRAIDHPHASARVFT